MGIRVFDNTLRFNSSLFLPFFTCIYIQGARHVGTSIILILKTTINYFIL